MTPESVLAQGSGEWNIMKAASLLKRTISESYVLVLRRPADTFTHLPLYLLIRECVTCTCNLTAKQSVTFHVV